MKATKKCCLDDVMITMEAYKKWNEFASSAFVKLQTAGVFVSPKDVPDEIATVLDSGELEVEVQVGGHKLAMKIPPEHWVWVS